MTRSKRKATTRRTALLEGLPVVDAKSPLIITVEQQDVRAIGRKRPDKCAAAMACARSFASEARVHLTRLYLQRGESWVRYQIPGSLRDELISFDRGGSFEPGEFSLRPIRPSHQAGAGAQGGKNKAATGKGKPRRAYHHVPSVRGRAPIEYDA